MSPWDDDARGEAEALWEAERLECPMCGNLREDCGDPDRLWYPQRHICYATRERDAADALYAEKHEGKRYSNRAGTVWSDKPTRQTPYGIHDGVRIWVAPYDVNPDDKFI